MTPAVVLDTNVFVAAGFNPNSSSARILEAVEQGAVHLVWNDGTRGETQAILSKIPPLSWQRWAGLFHQEHRFVGITHPDRFANISDPDDRKFAALARATGAILVSNDEHLLAHRETLGVRVLSPREFWSWFLEQT